MFGTWFSQENSFILNNIFVNLKLNCLLKSEQFQILLQQWQPHIKISEIVFNEIRWALKY